MSSPRHTVPKINVGEESFAAWAKRLNLPAFERNFRFHPDRKLEIDFAWPALKLGLEIQGGVWNAGKHGRPLGIMADMAKHNILLDLGWTVYQFTPQECRIGSAALHIERIINERSITILTGARHDTT